MSIVPDKLQNIKLDNLQLTKPSSYCFFLLEYLTLVAVLQERIQNNLK
jgi:hypothetical protein